MKATKIEKKKFEEYVQMMRSMNMEPSFGLEQWLVNYRSQPRQKETPTRPTPPDPQPK